MLISAVALSMNYLPIYVMISLQNIKEDTFLILISAIKTTSHLMLILLTHWKFQRNLQNKKRNG